MLSNSHPTLELEHIVAWCKSNFMELYLEKTKELLVSLRPSDELQLLPLRVSDVEIERVKSIKVLGLFITTTMKWNLHLQNLEKKCRSNLFLFWRLRSQGHSKTSINELIISLLLPKLTYAYPAWCNLSSAELKRVKRLYRRAAKIGNPLDLPELDTVLNQCICDSFRAV